MNSASVCMCMCACTNCALLVPNVKLVLVRVLQQSSTNSDIRPANQKAQTKIVHFLARWTCMIVCVIGP